MEYEQLLLLLNILKPKRYQKKVATNNRSDRPTRQRMIGESDKIGKRIETNGEKDTHRKQ